MRKKIGCIADDFTGATDLAGSWASNGLSVEQHFGVPADEQTVSNSDVLVVALKSRTSPTETAISQSLASLRWLKSVGAEQVYFKYCSTFDSLPTGNIGPVIDALMDAMGCDFTVATPAFPENGRTVFQGHLFVGNQLLSESGMRNHPLTPMTDSNLVRVLQAQTRRRVGLVPRETVALGVEAILSSFAALKRSGVGVAILDAVSNQDLIELGRAVRDMPLVTAASGLSVGVAAAHQGRRMTGSQTANFPKASGRKAIVSGSCSVTTQAQVMRHLEEQRPAYALDTLQILSGVDVVEPAITWARQQTTQAPLLIYTTAEVSRVRAIQERFPSTDTGGKIESALSLIAKRLVDELEVKQLVVAGGETSGACVQSLGVTRLSIGPLIVPGVPWCHGRTSRGEAIHIALKSGNFGSRDFFRQAFEFIQ